MGEAGLHLRKGIGWFAVSAVCKHSSLSMLAGVWIPSWSIMGWCVWGVVVVKTAYRLKTKEEGSSGHLSQPALT